MARMRTRSGREREDGGVEREQEAAARKAGNGGAEREQDVAVREKAVERWPVRGLLRPLVAGSRRYTYISMILGLAMHGRGEDALSLFASMQRAGVTPNEVTLLGVLTACCHAGLIEEGLQQLDAMRRNEIDKVPGCSLIEIDGVVHEFKAIPANSIR
ncbi:hypothetical protein OsJ_31320 [Oryza sativa Japonica Group]|uniref:PPR repeat domain containing protein n=2 Tax=Oryza sativa subsp. japonica TaxID=39947 RepID=A3C489_ORYSJ|nr:Putative PPR repeat domain containing protein [Oryza sativa Japonica Group]AAP53440.1 pentatricopeptide, putative [Oryza sativa Japonica Group]EAZ15902.1 hypothetical protein OsJ_31320 [Oryza sativa Japonica Group]